MIKSHVLIYLLLTFHLIIDNCTSTEVIWDNSNDIIYYEGKLYYPSKSNSHSDGSPNGSDLSNNSNHGTIDKLPENNNQNKEEVHHEELASGAQLWFYILMILVLTIGSGLFSGLTVGYLSIDDLILELRSKNGTDLERQYAKKVLPILSKRHWLLVSLLLMNAVCMEALPLFLDKIVPEFMAIIVSVSLVLVFGEIIPQAYCTGPDQVKIAASIAPLTKSLMLITYPISYPISLLLDYLLGEHTKSRFINNDIKGLIELHTYKALEKLNMESHNNDDFPKEKMGLNDEQANLMISALDMKEKRVIELMIPIKNSFMIDFDDILDKFKLNLILDKGYSRIPVYSNHNKNDIVGLLRIKQLIGIDFDQNKSLRQFGIELRKPIVISPRTSIFDLLREFRKGKSHMAFITEQVEDLQNKFGLNRSNSIQKDFSLLSNNSLITCEYPIHRKNYSSKSITVLGIITLEDIIEKMINLEILDEDDYEKVIKKRKINGNSKMERSKNLGREIASSFIREEGSQLESILTGSVSNRKTVKDFFIKKNLDVGRGRDSMNNMDDPLI